MTIVISILAVLGTALSVYMLMIEQAFEKDSTYKAACDLSEKISCTAALKSPYGRPFGVSNALLGCLFYPLLFLFNWLGMHSFVFYASSVACCMSLFLAFTLYTKIRVFCLVCTLLYAINALLLITSYMMQ